MPSVTVRHNPKKNRFEADINGKLATLDYERRGNCIALTHTNVPREFWGQGIGTQLTKAALEFAQGAALPVIPECGFVVGYLKRNPQFLNIVDSQHRRALEVHLKEENEGGLAA